MSVKEDIRKNAIEALLIESESINRLTESINDDFINTVQLILASKGRVVVTGIGKSANIGQKIVSTLNSTGTPSLFMHAADAIHGDLGMIQKEDIVICISKSGNTPEIKVLVPLLKRTGSKLVALIGNTDSYLATNADFVLNASVEKEADPNNLAPTTSTTATLALGDALAVCLIEARNFGSEDFAKYHPGGALGKKLYLTVSDIYINNEIPKVNESSTLEEVIFEISSKRLGATAVVDNKDKEIGIVTDGDIRRMLKGIVDVSKIGATDVMTSNPKVIEDGVYAVKALEEMQENNITQLIVVDHGILKGFVHLHDLIKEGLV
jgi:arabinose-5-phosphate isomerase